MFPRAKAAINAQHAAILEEGGEAEARHRSPARDALTVFDEGGVIVATERSRAHAAHRGLRMEGALLAPARRARIARALLRLRPRALRERDSIPTSAWWRRPCSSNASTIRPRPTAISRRISPIARVSRRQVDGADAGARRPGLASGQFVGSLLRRCEALPGGRARPASVANCVCWRREASQAIAVLTYVAQRKVGTP